MADDKREQKEDPPTDSAFERVVDHFLNTPPAQRKRHKPPEKDNSPSKRK